MSDINVLFISCNGIDDKSIGGPKGTIRNYECMSRYGEITNFHIVKKSNYNSAVSLIEGYYPPMDNAYYREIEDIIENKGVNIAFFDQSFYGDYVKRCKKKGCKTIVFCHNCEADYNEVRFTNTANIVKKKLYSKRIVKNERQSIQSSDVVVTFSERDANRIKELYGRRADFIIPLGLSDKYTGNKKTEIKYDVLVFSPVTEANLYGVRWFVNNVAHKINGKVLIAGNGFEQYSKELSRDNVDIIGYVDDIEEVYMSARMVAIPQFIGAGMKVKTAEALMFGKEIIGTKEAFEGYDDDIYNVSSLCNTADEFIKAINKRIEMQISSNETARQLYLDKYSINAGNRAFDEIIKEFGYKL